MIQIGPSRPGVMPTLSTFAEWRSWASPGARRPSWESAPGFGRRLSSSRGLQGGPPGPSIPTPIGRGGTPIPKSPGCARVGSPLASTPGPAAGCRTAPGFHGSPGVTHRAGSRTKGLGQRTRFPIAYYYRDSGPSFCPLSRLGLSTATPPKDSGLPSQRFRNRVFFGTVGHCRRRGRKQPKKPDGIWIHPSQEIQFTKILRPIFLRRNSVFLRRSNPLKKKEKPPPLSTNWSDQTKLSR